MSFKKSGSCKIIFYYIFRIPSFILMGVLKFYKLVISPWMPGACRFYPTCSEYSLQAIKKYGIFKGFYLSLKRVLRCNPYSKGGYDPLI